MSRFGYLGPADMLRLDVACAPIRDAFDAHPYLVGSVLERANYRDVDVRLVINDDEHERMFGDPADPRAKMRALLVNSAISDWLAKASGLPVDFQFQPVSESSEYNGRPRNALAMHDSAIRYAALDSTQPDTPAAGLPVVNAPSYPSGYAVAGDFSAFDQQAAGLPVDGEER